MSLNVFVPAASGRRAVDSVIGAITPDSEPELPEVSIVIPCLNEAETLGRCIDRAASSMREHGIAGEIIVADNGSFDDSRTIARRLGAVVVEVPDRGLRQRVNGRYCSGAGQVHRHGGRRRVV